MQTCFPAVVRNVISKGPKTRHKKNKVVILPVTTKTWKAELATDVFAG